MFFRNSCFFNDPADIGNLTSGSSAFSKTSLNMWKFTVHVLLKPALENLRHLLSYLDFFFQSLKSNCISQYFIHIHTIQIYTYTCILMKPPLNLRTSISPTLLQLSVCLSSFNLHSSIFHISS